MKSGKAKQISMSPEEMRLDHRAPPLPPPSQANVEHVNSSSSPHIEYYPRSLSMPPATVETPPSRTGRLPSRERRIKRHQPCDKPLPSGVGHHLPTVKRMHRANGFLLSTQSTTTTRRSGSSTSGDFVPLRSSRRAKESARPLLHLLAHRVSSSLPPACGRKISLLYASTACLVSLFFRFGVSWPFQNNQPYIRLRPCTT